MRLLCESVFDQINEWKLILKMVEREVFLMKLKHQNHLSHWGEYVCGPNHEMNGDYYMNPFLS